MHRSNFSSWIALSLLASTLSACGGGGGKSTPPPPPPTQTFTVGGTVIGLTGSGLVLLNNGGNPLPITANGTFTFTTAIANGSTYAVTVQTQPTGPAQTCTVTNGNGTISANVANVTVTCGALASAYPVGATVSGLAANAPGLVVTNNGGDNKAISANGAFVFDTSVAVGASYDIRVLSNPYDPYQDCSVENGSGTVAGAVTAATITCKSLEPRFVTTLDFNDSSYSQYAVDATTGQLRPRGYAKVGLNPVDVGAYADGKISFVLSRGNSQLHAFVRDSVTGRLTEAASSPQPVDAIDTTNNAPTGAQRLSIHPRLNFIYVANGGGSAAANSIAGFSFNTTTGVLTPIPGQPFAAGQRPIKLAIDPTGRFAYAANQTDNTITAYSIDQTTGALTSLGAAFNPVVHASGRWLYVLNLSPASVAAFSIGASGALTEVAGSPFAAPTNLTAPLLMHPTGQYLYAKTLDGFAVGYTIDATSGALAQIGSPVGLDDPGTQQIWMEASGRYLFTANRPNTLSGSVSVLKVDATNGSLTKLTGITPLLAPYSVSLDWSGKYLYVASADNNQLRTYGFNPATGALTPLAALTSRNSPVTIIGIPSASGDPATFASKFAYVPTTSAINAYSVNASTGAYTARTGIPGPLTSGVLDAAVHPSNSAVLALDTALSGTLKTYPMSATNGNLGASTDSVAAGTRANDIVVDPSGRFAYVPDAQANLLRAFDWQAPSGDLAVASTSGTTTQPFKVAMHPTGRFLFYISDARVGYRAINPGNGALSQIGSDESVASTFGQQAIAVHPNGDLVYVARTGNPGRIAGFVMVPAGPTAGQLNLAGDLVDVGNTPVSIAIDPTGRFMYVGQEAPQEILTFSIAANGSLTPVGAPLPLSGAAPVVVRADYSGKLLHVLDGTQVRTYTINQSTGALTATGATVTPSTPPNNVALSEDIE
jgi:6-phosphogluconolactonase (cycloisomerase 2 family)